MVLISHIIYFGAQMSYISVLISHIAKFGAHFACLYTGAQLSCFLGAQNTFFRIMLIEIFIYIRIVLVVSRIL